MDLKRIARLTEQQRACLRHVYAHLTSKEIAPILGIEPGSVDQHIKAAMKTLGVGDRRTAARIFAEYEAQGDSPVVAYPPLNPESPASPYNFVPPIVSGWQPHEPAGGSMREEQAFFRVATPGGSPTFQLPIGSSKPGDLNWATRLMWIAVIAIGVALAFGALVSAIEALGRLTQT
ncbi:MAG TPA: helix-turn-helix transcriptional regulator [Allosphingosinicella sp.]|jgi:DNA-binding CsgD family transcriptional regulator|nr:helix-turn-helix transcriptional regulator [Allosphingosinicella sp.]